jgi:hypothetical protein
MADLKKIYERIPNSVLLSIWSVIYVFVTTGTVAIGSTGNSFQSKIA